MYVYDECSNQYWNLVRTDDHLYRVIQLLLTSVLFCIGESCTSLDSIASDETKSGALLLSSSDTKVGYVSAGISVEINVTMHIYLTFLLQYYHSVPAHRSLGQGPVPIMPVMSGD